MPDKMPDLLMDKMTNEQSDQMVFTIKERMKAFIPVDADFIVILESKNRANFVTNLEAPEMIDTMDRVANAVYSEASKEVKRAIKRRRRE